MKKYKFYSDAGHGWLAVKRDELNALNLLNKISEYSYQKGQTVYLEEDCDAGLFIEAKKQQGQTTNIDNIINTRSDYSPIRNYKRFHPLPTECTHIRKEYDKV